ncbi:MAG: UDP-N-acetylmuramate dehydrogenase [Polyangiaceae bacterium]|nr:UDP-N-acetylmuramate dehydrogenase [Polyangiaceae bacterium]
MRYRRRVRRERDQALARWTTFGVGGPARTLWTAERDEELVEAAEAGATVLAGGSNVLVSDAGLADVVLVRTRGLSIADDGVTVTAAAGEPWDDVPALAARLGLWGVECLSGIPGSVGATPVQNVGAYGQEVSDTIREVRAWDRPAGRAVTLTPRELAFGYRDSALKGAHAGRFLVLSVVFSLRRERGPAPAYQELATALGPGGGATPAEVRDVVIALRRRKGMVLDTNDPDTRGAGSFFTNPTLGAAALDALRALAGAVPAHAAPDGRAKVPAAWLIERAGFTKGYARAGAAISSKHALALTSRGGAAADVFALAREIRDGVRARLGVTLVPEPVLLGFDEPL